MEAILISLLLWINQNTNFDYDLHLGIPALVSAEQTQLAAMMIDEDTRILEADNAASFKNYVDQLEAVYHHETKTILISSKIDLYSAYARSVMVHELVHFIQYQNRLNEMSPCLNALERDAYDIQALYMEAHGIPKNFDKLTIALRSICLDYAQ